MRKIYTIIIAINLFTAIQLCAQVLNVTQTFQEHDEWCWDGCSNCLLNYFGYSYSQCTIANYAWTRSDCCGNPTFSWTHACNQPNALCNNTGSVQDVISYFGNLQSYGVATYLPLSAIQTEIGFGRPFIIAWQWEPLPNSGGHAILCNGVSGNYVYYMNPWPGEGLLYDTYNWMVNGTNDANMNNGTHDWTQTLLLQMPDLTDTTGFSYNISGNNLTVNNIVKNIGNRGNNPTVTGYYFESSPSSWDYLIGTDNIPTLYHNQTFNQSITVDPCSAGVPNGTYYLAWYYNYTGASHESNFSNNGYYYPTPFNVTCGVGVNELSTLNSFSFYPNPSSGILTIDNKENNCEIVITNIIGEKVLSQKIQNEKLEIDLSNQPNGVYLLQVNSEKGNTTKKIIINK